MHLDDDDKHQLSQEERVNRIYEAGRAPAFPVTKFDDPHTIGDVRGGLTVREYFAIKVLAGIIAPNGWFVVEGDPNINSHGRRQHVLTAIAYADVLIAELNK